MFYFSTRFSALEDLIVATDQWQAWVASAVDATLRARVTWPVRAANLADYPYINLSPGRGRLHSITGGYESSASFVPTGTIIMRIWDRDADVDDPETSFETFEGNVTALLEDIIGTAHDGPLIINSIETDDPAIVHSHDNAYLLGEDAAEDPVWMATVVLGWGLG